MFDYVKLTTTYAPLVQYFQQSKLLHTTHENKRLNKYTGEYLSHEIREYNGIIFTFYTCTSKSNQQYVKLVIELKPHYLFNDNVHNSNKFKASDCIKVIQDFIKTFELSAVGCLALRVVGIEAGVNFLAHFKERKYGKELIEKVNLHGANKFLHHNKLEYSKASFYAGKDGKTTDIIGDKFYSKGIQSSENGVNFSRYCDIDTLRYEFKSQRSQWIKENLKIDTLLDLLNIESYILASEILIKRFRSVIICDTSTGFENLNIRQINKLKEYCNPLLWYRILRKRNAVPRRLKLYNSLLDKTGFNIHKELLKIIVKEVAFLVDLKIENVAYIGGSELLKLAGVSDYDKEVLICKFRKIENVAHINECTIDIRNRFNNNDSTQNKSKESTKTATKIATKIVSNICQITGIEKHKKDSSSNYARTTTLISLKENDYNKFIAVKTDLLKLSNRTYSNDKELLFILMEQIKNRYKNKRDFKEKGYKKRKYDNQYQKRLF